jgi:hypothetical protein
MESNITLSIATDLVCLSIFVVAMMVTIILTSTGPAVWLAFLCLLFGGLAFTFSLVAQSAALFGGSSGTAIGMMFGAALLAGVAGFGSLAAKVTL